MLLLVGLGNPTPNSQNNRHNIGFKVVDAINQKFGLSKQKPKFKGLLTTGNIGDKKILEHFCNFFTLISFTLWAEPIISNLFGKECFEAKLRLLLKEGIYTPLRPNLSANLILLDKYKFLLLILQNFWIDFISSIFNLLL